MATKIVMAILVLVFLSVNSEFPEDPKPCKYGDAECIKSIINYLIANKSTEGDASMNFAKLSPLKTGDIRLEQGKESPVNIDMLIKNVSVYGLDTSKAVKVKGFGKDLSKKHSILFHFDYLRVVGDYEINGKVLILPIKGNGACDIGMVGTDVSINFVGTPLERNGDTYMQVQQKNVNIETKKMTFEMNNLFNGDKALGDNMNLFLNDNWQDVFNELRGSLSKAYGEIIQKLINDVFSKRPYDKYFSD